jgi:hypothetical protein
MHCPNCNRDKDHTEFYVERQRSSGYSCYCKACVCNKKAQHYRANKSNLKAKAREHYAKSPQGKRDKSREYAATHKAKKLEYNHEYYSKNREKLCAASRTRYAADPQPTIDRFRIRWRTDLNFRLAHRLRVRVRKALQHGVKGGSAVKDLGCTLDELRAHITAQFEPGMTWDNWGLYGWHIDHIIPLASFDLTDPAQFKQAAHYTNLQPLWAGDNMAKGASIA